MLIVKVRNQNDNEVAWQKNILKAFSSKKVLLQREGIGYHDAVLKAAYFILSRGDACRLKKKSLCSAGRHTGMPRYHTLTDL